MCVAFVFIVAEYCTQSHLSTNDYENAVQGLRRTRWFKKYTYFHRSAPDLFSKFGGVFCHKILRNNVRREADLGLGLEDGRGARNTNG